MSWKDKGYPLGVGPNDWIGRKTAGYGYLRNPRVSQEQKLWDAEYGRPARSPHRILGGSDEVGRHDSEIRSWKRHRQTQYKMIVM